MMTALPQPFWAVILAVMGVILAIVVYIVPGDVTTRQAAFQIASALVTGALGAFAGHAASNSNQKFNAPNSTINANPPTDPKEISSV